MRRISPKASLRAVALVITSAVVLFTAACGSGGSGNSTSGGGAGQDGNRGNGRFTAYIQCLQKNGVTIALPSGAPGSRPSGGPRFPSGARPSGTPRPSASGFPGRGGLLNKPPGVDDTTWQKAQQACASLRPAGPGRNGANAAYRNCLKDHGVTATEGNPDTTDPAVKKAMETCKALRPQANPTPTATP